MTPQVHVLPTNDICGLPKDQFLPLLLTRAIVYSKSSQHCLAPGKRALTACDCREAPASMAVQLTSMEDTLSSATCMTSDANTSRAAVGLSSGQILLVSHSQKKPGLTRGESRSIASVPDTVTGDKSSKPGCNSNAALAVVTLPEQHAAAVISTQLSPDCRNLATIASDGAVFVWDTFPGSDADLYVTSRTSIAGASCATWLPGRRLLVGSSSHQLLVSP